MGNRKRAMFRGYKDAGPIRVALLEVARLKGWKPRDFTKAPFDMPARMPDRVMRGDSASLPAEVFDRVMPLLREILAPATTSHEVPESPARTAETEQAIKQLLAIVSDPEVAPGVRVEAAKVLLSSSHGKA